MNNWEAKTLDVQFKNFVPKALIETLKHQHNTCIGRRTYMKLANAIGKKILGLKKLEDYSISQEDILNHFIESKDDDCVNIIAIPSAYPYSNINETLALLVEYECGFPVDIYFSKKRCNSEACEDGVNSASQDPNYKDKGIWIIWKKGESPLLPKGVIKNDSNN